MNRREMPITLLDEMYGKHLIPDSEIVRVLKAPEGSVGAADRYELADGRVMWTPGNRGWECRKCSQCAGASHHWIATPMPPNQDWRGREYACKHCDQCGEECCECDGAGNVAGVMCEACSGDGVVLLPEQANA